MKRYGLHIALFFILLAALICPAYIVDTGRDWRLTGAVLENCLLTGSTLDVGRGATYFADGDNGDDTSLGTSWIEAFETIQAAVTAAEDYSTIYVGGGSYAETVTTVAGIDHVRLVGVSRHKQTPQWTNATPTVATSAHLHIDGSGWVVKGFRFHHGSTSAAPAIVIDGYAGALASGCQILDNYFTSSGSATASGGIEMRYSAYDHKIIGNEFFNLTDTGSNGQGGAIYNCGNTQAGLPGNGAVGLVIENNRFFHNKLCIGISGAFNEYRGNVFSGMQQDDDQHTTQYIKITHMTDVDGDQTSNGSNIVVGNYFPDHFSWEIISGNGYFFNDTDSVAGNFCKDGVMGRGGPSSAQSDAADAQLVPGRTYVLHKHAVLTGTTEDLFSVSGGSIEITGFFGMVTTDIGTAGNLIIELDHADDDYDADFTVLVDVDAVDQGDIMLWKVIAAGVSTMEVTAQVNSSFVISWFCPAGMIEQTTGSGTTGAITWYMKFIPLEPGVSVVAQ